LTSDGNDVVEKVQVGIVAEAPSAVVMGYLFASDVDFFSIGTEDFMQYTLSAQRTDARVAYLADACHPVVPRQIHFVIEAGRKAGICGEICGEFGGDAVAIPILPSLDEFSMIPLFMPRAKSMFAGPFLRVADNWQRKSSANVREGLSIQEQTLRAGERGLGCA
jgi:phosphotransferase system enzyme I (PtsI)